VSDIAIRVEDLSKTFKLHHERRNSAKERFVRGKPRHDGLFVALDDLTFEIERGTTFGLIGHNGSGKSTLLKILAGVYRPSKGAVMVDGRVSALLELGAGFHGELTGRENIFLNGAILGMTRRQIAAALDEIIEFAGIGEFIDSPVKIYSSGMYVRLGFAIAVTLEPEILIVDEIIAVGDEEFQRKCFDYLFELRRQGTTIVLVTHSMGLAADLCDQAVWLDHGEMRSIGPVREVIDDYLANVNEREAEANARSGDSGGGDAGTGRLGTGEARVDAVSYHDATGAEVSFFTAAEPCIVRFHYTAKTAIREVVFGLAFVHESGVTVAGPNSGQLERAYDLDAGSGYVDFSLGALPLQPGLYRMSTAIVSHGRTYDYVDRGFELRVRSDSAVTEPGLVRVFGTWGEVVGTSQVIGGGATHA
jgi:ABC-2 type transport system ATP-binding protein/lipopolysaccharide transport system ATP-binding protein